MRLHSLHLRGAIGIGRGLGLEEITIDFTRFDSGLVAFVGQNGRGKSTILESLQPFRRLVSRDGALHRHFYLKDSRRDLRFEMNGHEYRSLILIDGVRGGQEAYLYRDGEPITDGKTTTYDAAVEELFGSEDLFFRSLFQSQTRESITSLTAGKRKAFFAELLGLDHLQRHHETAKAEAATRETALLETRARIAARRETAAGLKAAEARAETLRYEHAQIRERIKQVAADAEDAKRAEADVAAKLAELETEIRRREDLSAEESETGLEMQRLFAAIADAERRLDSGVRAELDAFEAAVRTAEGKRDADLKAIEHEHNSAEARIADQAVVARSKLERADRILANGAAIEKGLADLAAARAEVGRFDALRDEEQRLYREWQDAERAFRIARQARESWQATLDGLLAEQDRRRQAAALTETVPCADEAPALQPRCALLSHSLREREAADAMESQIEAQRKVEPPVADDTAALDIEAKYSALEYSALDHERAEQTLRDLEARNWPGIAAEAATAEALAAELREQIATLDAETARLAKSFAARRVECEAAHTAEIEAIQHNADARTAERRASFDREKAAVDATLAALEAKRGKLLRQLSDLAQRASAEPKLREAIELARGRQNTCRLAAEALENEERTAVVRIGANESEIRICRGAAAEADRLAEESAGAEREFAEWALLARALGKDGLQALELDAAGPGVSAIANQLLAETFGSEFQIAFETTRQTADGKKQIETFEIKIYHGGSDQEIENLSGGQRVWIEAALSQAIAIYLRRKSGHDLRTAFLDEADGALDSDNAFRYLAMLRASHALSGAHHTLLITHRTELLAHVPQQIRLVPGEGIEYVN